MTNEQFIAWFDGFTRHIKGRPSSKDWAEIVAAIGRIDGASPLKAWFEGLRVKVKGVPSERDWREIVKRVGGGQKAPGGKTVGLNESFKSYDKKAKPAETKPGANLGYPGAQPFGKKR